MGTRQDIQEDISKYDEAVKLNDALRRLESNSDFKLLITEGLFDKKLKQIVAERLSAQNGIGDKALDSISYLTFYFSTIKRRGESAKDSINACYKLMDELED